MSTPTKPDASGLHKTDTQERATPEDVRDLQKETLAKAGKRSEEEDDFSVLLHLGLV